MRSPTLICLSLLLLEETLSKSALENFVSKKRVERVQVNVLRDEGASNSTWIEYNYVFSDGRDFDFARNTLRIGVFRKRDYEFDCRIKKIENDTVQIEGFSADLLESLRDIYKFRTEFVEIDLQGELNVDLIICHPSIKTNKFIQLRSTLISNFALVYKPSRLNFTKDIFILTFVGTLWLSFLLLFIALAICLRIATIQYAKLHPNCKKWNWVEITLWAIAAACQQGYSTSPSRFASCCIFLIGYLTAYLLYTGFAAAITSVLLREDNTKLDKSKLHSLDLVLYGDSQISYESFKSVKYVWSLEGLFEEIERKYTVGLAPSLLIREFVANSDNKLDYIYKPLPEFYKFRKGFLANKNFTFWKGFNKHLLRLEESGVVQLMLSRNSKRLYGKKSLTGYSSAGLEHVGSAIYVIAAGVLAGLVFLVCEHVLVAYKKHKRKQRRKRREREEFSESNSEI